MTVPKSHPVSKISASSSAYKKRAADRLVRTARIPLRETEFLSFGYFIIKTSCWEYDFVSFPSLFDSKLPHSVIFHPVQAVFPIPSPDDGETPPLREGKRSCSADRAGVPRRTGSFLRQIKRDTHSHVPFACESIAAPFSCGLATACRRAKRRCGTNEASILIIASPTGNSRNRGRSHHHDGR